MNEKIERLIKAGLVNATWFYSEHICQYPDHAKLNGKKFPIRKGARISLFKRIYPGQLDGCSCFLKPVLPF